jgi:hypothetical protein
VLSKANVVDFIENLLIFGHFPVKMLELLIFHDIFVDFSQFYMKLNCGMLEIQFILRFLDRQQLKIYCGQLNSQLFMHKV